MFFKSPEIAAYAQAIIQVFPEHFEHLQECRIGYLITDEEIRMQGRDKAGYAIMPQAMGQNGKLFDWTLAVQFGFIDECFDAPVPPDAIMVVQQEAWQVYQPIQRAGLVFHELKHIAHLHTKDGEPRYSDEDGRPLYSIIGHDVEEFTEVAALFGQQTQWKGFAQIVLGSELDPRVHEVIRRAHENDYEPLPKRPPPPAFRCKKCETAITGKPVAGWLVVDTKCPQCGAKTKPVKR